MEKNARPPVTVDSETLRFPSIQKTEVGTVIDYVRIGFRVGAFALGVVALGLLLYAILIHDLTWFARTFPFSGPWVYIWLDSSILFITVVAIFASSGVRTVRVSEGTVTLIVQGRTFAFNRGDLIRPPVSRRWWGGALVEYIARPKSGGAPRAGRNFITARQAELLRQLPGPK
jgi:hypothetical protein